MASPVLIIGAGFSGAVLARQLADAGRPVVIFESRPHLAGNCHTERDEETGIMVHRYGPHIFHTSSDRVWAYVNRFGRFQPYVNRVRARIGSKIFPLPINLQTINGFFGVDLDPEGAKQWIKSRQEICRVSDPNFEEVALATIGRELYEAFFRGYTKKQWGCDPRELPGSIFSRLPVRFHCDDNYFNDPYQGIPENGYTAVVESLLSHPLVECRVKRPVSPWEVLDLRANFAHVVYTGSLDAFFDYQLGRLSYRTVEFERIETDKSDYQGCAIVNYPSEEVPYTRIHEHKHFASWEEHERTVAFREFSKETGPEDEPYYPKRLPRDKQLLKEYRRLALQVKGVSFLGRLATYRYLDMDDVIGEALDFSESLLTSLYAGTEPASFPVEQ